MILFPTPCTLHPPTHTPCTLHPLAPCTLLPVPYTSLLPVPYSLYPTPPYSMYPTPPCSLNPTPCTLHLPTLCLYPTPPRPPVPYTPLLSVPYSLSVPYTPLLPEPYSLCPAPPDPRPACTCSLQIRSHPPHPSIRLHAEPYMAACPVQATNLQLDDLEVGSLRGRLASSRLDADLSGRQGRASVSLEGLKYAALQAAGLSGSVRWEGDIVKLEETVLEQLRSRCREETVLEKMRSRCREGGGGKREVTMVKHLRCRCGWAGGRAAEMGV